VLHFRGLGKRIGVSIFLPSSFLFLQKRWEQVLIFIYISKKKYIQKKKNSGNFLQSAKKKNSGNFLQSANPHLSFLFPTTRSSITRGRLLFLQIYRKEIKMNNSF
jgi:hypothetical protein